MKRKLWIRALALVLAGCLMFSLVSFDFRAGKFRTRQDRLEAYVASAQENMENGNYTAAERNLSKAISCIGRKTEVSQISELYLTRAGIRVLCTADDAGALSDAQEVIALSPDSPEPYAILAQVQLNAEQYDEAALAMQTYLDLGGDEQGYETLAAILNAQGRQEEALSAFEKAEAAGSITAYQRGVLLHELGHTEEALSAFESCPDEDPYCAAALLNAAVLRMEREEYEEAEQDLGRAIALGSDFSGLHFNRAICRMLLGEYAEAAEDFLASVEENYSTGDAYRNLASCRMQLGDYQAALEALQHLITGNTPADEALYFRAVCFCQVGEYQASVDDFSRCIEEHFMEIESRFNRALLCAALGDADTAIEDFSYCIEADYERAECYRQRAQLYLQQGNRYLYTADLIHISELSE